MSVPEFRLLTPRLCLRTPVLTDAAALQAIAADPRVALTTASIPHPYPHDGALSFITQARMVAGPSRRNLAITLATGNELIGMIGFGGLAPEAELSYMISPKHWRRGYATEAAVRLIDYLFKEIPFSAVVAKAMCDNPASEAVLRKAGLQCVACADVDIPLRGGVFRTSFWRRDRAG